MADHVERRSVNIDELADAIRMQKGTRSSKPWWVDFIGKVGVGAAFGFLLLKFVTGEMTLVQKATLENTAVSRGIMEQAEKDMSAFASRDESWKELMLMVNRQTCRNAVPMNSPTARADRDACDVIRPPR